MMYAPSRKRLEYSVRELNQKQKERGRPYGSMINIGYTLTSTHRGSSINMRGFERAGEEH